jgi:RNA-directed DNA polymerase (EC 2.7.7.49)
VEKGEWLFPEEGTPQGGVLSPLLANIALHGLERAITGEQRRPRITVIRYADDFVVLCEDRNALEAAKERAETWLAGIGLRLKEAKTRMTHTLEECEGSPGFDFLGFHVRQYRVGKYRTRTYRGRPGFKRSSGRRRQPSNGTRRR